MPNLIISGGRNWTPSKDSESIVSRIISEHGITCILEGGATGCDRWAGEYAKSHGLELQVFRADWDRLGLRAGPIRNMRMALACIPLTDGVILFKGGKGTASMKREALAAGLTIWHEE